MILSAWVLVTTTLLISVDGENECPSKEELIKMAKALTDDPKPKDEMEKYLRAMKAMTQDIPAGLPDTGEIKDVLYGSAIGYAIIGGYGNVLVPQPKKGPLPPVFFSCNATDPDIPEIKAMVEKFGPALDNLTDLVKVEFKKAREQVKEALGKIEELLKDTERGAFQTLWSQNIVPKMRQLRDNAEHILEKKYIKAGGDIRAMAQLCLDTQTSPYAIATMIWSQFGAACKGPPGVRTTTTIGQFCDRDHPLYTGDCIVLEDSCYAEVLIERDGYDHRTATRISTVVMETILELSTYHVMCVNFTWNDPEDVETANKNFFQLMNETLLEMSQIIMTKAEGYWPDAATEVVKNTVSQHSDLETAGKVAHDELNTKFFWFHHTTIAAKRQALYRAGHLVRHHDKNHTFIASKYRYLYEKDKASVKKKCEKNKEWLDSRLTGNYSEYIVRQFFQEAVDGDKGIDWTHRMDEVLDQFAGGEMNNDRMAAFVNLWCGEHAVSGEIYVSKDAIDECDGYGPYYPFYRAGACNAFFLLLYTDINTG